MSGEVVTWINYGRSDCKGNTRTRPEARGAILRTTCDKCALNWTTPAPSGVSR